MTPFREQAARLTQEMHEKELSRGERQPFGAQGDLPRRATGLFERR
jgi:hypothetical protein